MVFYTIDPSVSDKKIRNYSNPYSVQSPDSVPTVVNLNFSSLLDNNDLFYYLGTNQLNTTFSESNLLANMNVNYAYLAYDGTPVTGGFLDRNTATAKSLIGGNNSTEVRANTTFDMKTKTFQFESFTVTVAWNGWFYACKIFGSNDNTNWVALYDQPTDQGAGGSIGTTVTRRFIVNATSFYRYIRFNRAYSIPDYSVNELRFYGKYAP